MAKKQQMELPPIEFVGGGETEESRAVNLQMVLPSVGFPAMAYLLFDLVVSRVDLALLDFLPNGVVVRFQIDGVWHDQSPMDRETGDYLLASLKQLVGTDYRERRARQQGQALAIVQFKKYPFRVVTQGVATGERVAIYVDRKRGTLDNLNQLGMRPKMLTEVQQILGLDQGLVLCCGMPNEGYTSTWRGVLGTCDRYVRDHFLVEDEALSEPEVINYSVVKYRSRDGEHPFTHMPSMLLREPHVIAFAEIPDGETLNRICQLMREKQLLIITRIMAGHAVEALARLAMLKPDLKRLADSLTAVIASRVVRKLCTTCRQSYQPSPEMLQRLGIPPGRVREFFTATTFQPGQVDENGQEILPCPDCMGYGYCERIGVFELLRINDVWKRKLLESPRVDALMAAAREARHTTMRDEAVALVAKGVTSMEEVQRVFARKK